jgi:hypothetical protein
MWPKAFHAVIARRKFLIGSGATLGLAAVTSCETTSGAPSTPAEATAKRREIDAGVDATLARLYNETPGSQELLQKAKGVLVFPKVLAAGVGIGGEYGEGALRSGGRTIDYYKTTTGSLGFQLGAQSKAIILGFMTDAAYQQFRNSSGWTRHQHGHGPGGRFRSHQHGPHVQPQSRRDEGFETRSLTARAVPRLSAAGGEGRSP